MNERTEEIVELFEDVESILADAPETQEHKPAAKRTLLEVWAKVLESIEAAESQQIPMPLAARIIASYPQIKVQEIQKYHRLYHGKLKALRSILLAEIATDEDCFKHVEDDAEKNHHHYLNLLVDWQRQIKEWESNWNSGATLAHVDMAAVADASSFFLGQQGLVAHLDQINFVFTDDESEAVMAAIGAE